MANLLKQSYKQNYTDNVELSIFNCGHEFCQPGHTWGPGVRDHYLIHLVVAGRGVYQVGGLAFHLQEGDLFLAKPNQLITYAADETDPWEYYWVGFNGACANKLVQQTPFTDQHPLHHCKDPQGVREALYNIYLSRGTEPQCEALMTGYLYLFMAQLMKEARDALPGVPLITMAMGPLGAVTRVCGGAFGSAATFGTAGVSSAPGQPDAAALRRALDALDACLNG